MKQVKLLLPLVALLSVGQMKSSADDTRTALCEFVALLSVGQMNSSFFKFLHTLRYIKETSSLITPLHHAISDKKDEETLMKCVTQDEGINAKDIGGLTPLHYAASINFEKGAQILLDNGADLNAKDKEGKTPLELAEKYSEVESLLIKAGAKLSSKL